MVVIVDANILFSALITPDNKIGEIIASPTANVQFISSHYAFVELFKHQPKIIKYARRSEKETLNILETLLRNIEFYSEATIKESSLNQAEQLTLGVDLYDINYVALTLETGGILWTGDKKLSIHLKKMGFESVYTTAELYDLLNIG
jgi:predicted nucleic acid-binding protein